MAEIKKEDVTQPQSRPQRPPEELAPERVSNEVPADPAHPSPTSEKARHSGETRSVPDRDGELIAGDPDDLSPRKGAA